MVWTISNLCRGKPQPDITLVRDCIPALSYVISRANDSSIIVDATWALSYLSDGDVDRIEHLVPVIPIMFTLLENECASNVLLPVLRTLGNIVTGNERQTQMVIDAGILKHANKLLHSPSVRMRCKCHEVIHFLLSFHSLFPLARRKEGDVLALIERCRGN